MLAVGLAASFGAPALAQRSAVAVPLSEPRGAVHVGACAKAPARPGRCVALSQFLDEAPDGQDVSAAIARAVRYLNREGGGTLAFAGVTAFADGVVFSHVAHITLEGGGAVITRRPGTASSRPIFTLADGVRDFRLRGFARIDGGYPGATMPSTGERPVILIGDDQSRSATCAGNVDIRIEQNGIAGGNWAGVMIYGRTMRDTATACNRAIVVRGNAISASSNGVFVYKNAQAITIADNVIEDIGYDGIVLDSRAQSDAIGSGPISDVQIDRNQVRRFGSYGSGVGLLIKGQVRHVRGANNRIRQGLVNAGGSFRNAAVEITRDFGLAAPADIALRDTDIRDIASSQPKSGYGVVVAGGSAIVLDGLQITATSGPPVQIAGITRDMVVRRAQGDARNSAQ